MGSRISLYDDLVISLRFAAQVLGLDRAAAGQKCSISLKISCLTQLAANSAVGMQSSRYSPVFDLLEYLITNRDHHQTKDDILGAIWGGRIVSESALTTRINAARTAVGDNGDEQRLRG
jgi:hypothetical protein